MASQQAPAVPPRPARSKSPLPSPAIPPRPAARSKSPAVVPASDDDGFVVVASEPDHHQQQQHHQQQPALKTIPPSTELHAPVALSSRPAVVPRAESDTSVATSTPAPHASSYGRLSSSAAAAASADDREKEGIPHIGRRVPMYPNAGDVQAPSPTETPSSGRKKHVYREEWEMNEGAYGQKRRETPYSMSSTDLNAVVAPSSSSMGVSENECGVPDEEVGYLASDEYSKALSRSHSPIQTRDSSRLSVSGGRDDACVDRPAAEHDDDAVIHLEDPVYGPGLFRRGNSSHVASRAESVIDEDVEEAEPARYSILAEDEVLKRQQGQYMQAAVYTPSYTPRHHRSRPPSSMMNHPRDDEGASLELTTDFTATTNNNNNDNDNGGSQGQSRDSHRTPYDDLSPADEDAKPLFPESDDEKEKEDGTVAGADRLKRPSVHEHRFPSQDVWEEAPDHSQLEATIEGPPPTSTTETPTIAEEDRDGDHDEPVEDDEAEVDAEGEVSETADNKPKLRYIQGQPHQHYEPGDEQEDERKQKDAARKATDYRLDLQDLPQDDDRLQRLHKNGSGEAACEAAHTGRRGSRKKFPSNDIWEDVPPSLDLKEELEPSDQHPETEQATATTGAVSEPGAPTEGSTAIAAAAAAAAAKPSPPARPSVPARPLRGREWPPATIPEQPEPAPASPDKKTPPSIPERPKPNVPARPAKLAARTASEEKAAAAAAAGPEPKPKPPVPPRIGDKMAALSPGFLGNLESTLRLGGPPVKRDGNKAAAGGQEGERPAKEEPLHDVRKSRTRGPRGRRPPTMDDKPALAAEGGRHKSSPPQHCEFVGVWTVFTLDRDLNAVVVVSTDAAGAGEQAEPPETKTTKTEASKPLAAEEGNPTLTPASEDAGQERVEKPIEA